MQVNTKGLATGILLVVALLLTSCASSESASNDTDAPVGTSMPDLKGVSVESAEQIVVNNNWIPRVIEESSPTISEGLVTRTNPTEGTLLEPGASVSIYVSSGPALTYVKDAVLEWVNTTNDVADTWNFESPYIYNQKLIINLVDVSLAQDITWKDGGINGTGIGRASITDTFDKTVPIEFYCGNCKFEKQEIQNLELEIPLGDLDVDKPTQIYVELYAETITISLNFNLTW